MLPTASQPNGQNAPLAATSGTTGGVGGPSASPPGGTPKSMRRQRPPQTFAGMQQQGVARPSPAIVQQTAQANAVAQQQAQQQAQQAAPQPAVQPAPAPTMQYGQPLPGMAQTTPMAQGAPQGGGMIGSLGGTLQQQVMQMLADPTAGLNDAAMSNFDRQQRLIGQQFADSRSALNENLAARGLDASTIAASGLSRLEERQGQALADASAQIQEQLIRDRSSALNNAINAAMGLRGQEIGLDQNLWERTNADRNFGLQAELGRGNLDLNRQNLDLARDRFGFEQFRDNRNFDYGRERDAVGDAQFDRRFDFDVSRDARNFDYQAAQDAIRNSQWQQGFDRDGVWRGEDMQYRDARDRVADERFNRTFDRDQTWRDDDLRYRDERDTVGDQRWQQTFDTANRQQTTQNLLGLLQGMGFNNISPAIMQQIMASLGLSGGTSAPAPGLPSPVGTGGSVGGGFRDDMAF